MGPDGICDPARAYGEAAPRPQLTAYYGADCRPDRTIAQAFEGYPEATLVRSSERMIQSVLVKSFVQNPLPSVIKRLQRLPRGHHSVLLLLYQNVYQSEF